jgi:hypothetical protein
MYRQMSLHTEWALELFHRSRYTLARDTAGSLYAGSDTVGIRVAQRYLVKVDPNHFC